MQDENLVHRLGEDRVWLVFLAGNTKHHLQEILRIGQVVAGIHERLTNAVLVTPGRNGRHFSDQSVSSDFTLLDVGDIHLVVIERRQGSNDAAHNGHRMRITAETLEEVAHLVVQHRVVFDGVMEALVLFRCRKLAVKQEVADFQVVGVFCQFLDWVASVQENALGSVDVGDLGFAGCGGYEYGCFRGLIDFVNPLYSESQGLI